MTKICLKCKQILELNNFAKNKLGKDGLYDICRSCKKLYDKEYLKTDKGKEAIKRHNNSLAGKKARKRWNNSVIGKEIILKSHNKWQKKQYKINPGFKIEVSLRRRFLHAIKNNVKCNSILLILGCSIKFLKKYLESQFLPGMNWENYGLRGWHIDHIRPCSSYDLSKPEEQIKCFHYTNLQPLWAKDNLSKSDN